MRSLVQGALDLWLADAPEARARLTALAGKSIAVELTDLEIGFTLYPVADGCRVEVGATGSADARLSAASFDLLRLSRSRGATGAPGRIEMTGDAELAETVRDILRAVPFDPEERFARVVGDVPAHEAARAVRGLLAIGRRSADEAGRMLAEYLKYETRDLPTRDEVDGFVVDVDALSDAVARAAARLERVAGR